MSNTACRVLVIDDNADDRADLRQMLLRGSDQRYQFTEAELGFGGLRLVSDAQAAEPGIPPFDCILLDFHLPDIDAHQMLAALCASGNRPPCPVVVVTGWNGVDSTDGSKLLRAGAQDYIGKSWTTPESLTRAVENAMERYEMMAQRDVEARSLSESEQRYRNLFESIDDCLCVLEKIETEASAPVDFRCVDMNPAFAARYGMSDQVGKTLRCLFPSEPEEWFAIYERVWVTGVAARFVGGVPAESRELALRAFRIGEPAQLRLVVIRNDITHRKEAERRLLEQAQTLADQDRRKNEFLAMLSHELRNPLAPISNAVYLLRMDKIQAPKQLQALDIIERQVGQLKHMVNDLMEVSRITTGQLSIRKERIAFGDVVERAVETAQPLIMKRRHRLEVLVPPQPVWLLADPARLEQTVVNLLINAAKYTEEGGFIELTVQLEGGLVVLKVRDTGIGISAELLPEIFQMFTQADRSLDRSQGGLGIGLYLVQRVVELHGGVVDATSVVGQGSEFTVRLPWADALSPCLSTAPASFITMPLAQKGHRVLVVDDNRDAADSLASLLVCSGHEVQLAYDGPSALAMAMDFKPDAVSLDIGLPGLDGYETARQMREQHALRNTVLIALTGYGSEADRERSREAGFDHHLVKPAKFEELEILLNGARQPRPPGLQLSGCWPD